MHRFRSPRGPLRLRRAESEFCHRATERLRAEGRWKHPRENSSAQVASKAKVETRLALDVAIHCLSLSGMFAGVGSCIGEDVTMLDEISDQDLDTVDAQSMARPPTTEPEPFTPESSVQEPSMEPETELETPTDGPGMALFEPVSAELNTIDVKLLEEELPL